MKDAMSTETETTHKHTPGPWRWWGCKDGSYNPLNDYAQIASGPEHVAQVRLASTTEADLRLMVAAPDLLAALERLLMSGDVRDAGGAGALKQARAAIAKATGAAP